MTIAEKDKLANELKQEKDKYKKFEKQFDASIKEVQERGEKQIEAMLTKIESIRSKHSNQIFMCE